VHARRAVSLENHSLLKWIILPNRRGSGIAALEALANQDVIRDTLTDEVEGKQRMAQMVERAEEKD
jgi:hypothetical protein